MAKLRNRFCIDAGHGGKDAGAVNGDLLEKDAALCIALALGDELVARGQEVVFTRETDEFVELGERCRISNVYNCDKFISIHLNSVENNALAQGIETWYYRQGALARKVQEALMRAELGADRGIKKGDFYVLKHTKAPAVLIEVGFISNKAEAARLFSAEHQLAIAKTIATVLTGQKQA